MTPIFPGDTIRAMILAAVVCSLFPLVFLGYYRAKTKVKLTTFFIGMGCYFVFSYFGGSIVNLIFLSVFRLGILLADHPVYLAIYYSLSAGICGVLGLFFGLKYAMKNRPGKQNAFLFGLGAGGLECILYGGIVNITALILALFVNSFGMEGYLTKMQIPAQEFEAQKQLIQARAAIAPSAIYSDALLQFLSMCLQAALSIFIYYAISRKEYRKLLPAAAIIHIVGYLPIYLSQADILTNDTITIVIMTIYIFTVVFFAYRLYHREE